MPVRSKYSVRTRSRRRNDLLAGFAAPVMTHSRETQQFARRPRIDHHPPLRSARSHPAVPVQHRSQATHAATWELIVVDDGSTDETSAYLASEQDAAPVPVTEIADATGRVLPAAINQGLRAARGEYLVVLNNDVVVTDGWLGQLIALANAKGDFAAEHAEHAETKTVGEREGRPAVDLGAGSGDPRTARGTGVPPSEGTVIGYAETTPPDPRFARGGKRCVRCRGRACAEAMRRRPERIHERLPARELQCLSLIPGRHGLGKRGAGRRSSRYAFRFYSDRRRSLARGVTSAALTTTSSRANASSVAKALSGRLDAAEKPLGSLTRRYSNQSSSVPKPINTPAGFPCLVITICSISARRRNFEKSSFSSPHTTHVQPSILVYTLSLAI
jgi:hypothetical protein